MDPPGEQHHKHHGVDGGLAPVGLDLPPEVHATEDRGRINELVQPVPTSPETTHPARSRSDGEWHQHQECRKPHGDVRPLGNVRRDRSQVEPLVEHQPVEEVQAQVSEGVEAEHAPQAHQPGLAQLDGEW